MLLPAVGKANAFQHACTAHSGALDVVVSITEDRAITWRPTASPSKTEWTQSPRNSMMGAIHARELEERGRCPAASSQPQPIMPWPVSSSNGLPMLILPSFAGTPWGANVAYDPWKEGQLDHHHGMILQHCNVVIGFASRCLHTAIHFRSIST